MSNWFVALPVVDEGWFSRVSPTPTGTRLLAAADLHLTVAFLGDVRGPCARGAFQAVAPTAIPRFEVRLGRVVAMGNPRRPSALSAEVEGTDAEGRPVAEILAAPRDAILEAAALPAETRTMRPHVTLARPRRKASRQERQHALEWAAELDLSSIRLEFDRIALYTGARDRTTRAYDIVESRGLIPFSSGQELSADRSDE